jgi:hypothetical protein
MRPQARQESAHAGVGRFRWVGAASSARGHSTAFLGVGGFKQTTRKSHRLLGAPMACNTFRPDCELPIPAGRKRLVSGIRQTDGIEHLLVREIVFAMKVDVLPGHDRAVANGVDQFGLESIQGKIIALAFSMAVESERGLISQRARSPEMLWDFRVVCLNPPYFMENRAADRGAGASDHQSGDNRDDRHG